MFKLPWRSGSISSGCSDASSVNADARMSTSSTAHHHHHGGARPPSFQEDIEALPSHVQVDHSEHEVQPKLTVPLALGLMLGVTAITGYAERLFSCESVSLTCPFFFSLQCHL